MSEHTAPATLVPSGAFSLRRAATFGFGQRVAFGQRVGEDGDSFDGVMRMAFVLDGYRTSVGVEVRQADEPDGEVVLRVDADPDVDPAVARAQVARVLSLDHDARGYEAVGERDPVVAALLRLAPGLRPPLFHSPYEAAAWAVLSARRPQAQMAQVRRGLNEAHGRRFDLAGQSMAAFPVPERLLEVREWDGLDEEKMRRLHGVAEAALDGRLDAAALLELGPAAATRQVQELRGIGAFYAALIVVRGTGFADVLPTAEPRLLDLVARLYGLDGPPDPAAFEALAQPWAPFRTWVSVLVRSTGEQLLAGDAAQRPGRR